MALLLAMYQKMKLVREQNQISYKLATYTTKVDRIAKNIERTQKRYTSLFTRLEQKAKRDEANAKQMWTNMANMGGLLGGGMSSMGSVFGGMLGGTAGGMLGGMASGLVGTIFNNLINNSGGQLNENAIAAMQDGSINVQGVEGEYTSQEAQQVYAVMQQASQNANYLMQMQQQWANNNMTQHINAIQAQLEIDQAALEAEQEAVLQPLQYEETMMELEKTQAEQRLERIKANLESYKQLASEEARNSAPSFGLG